MARWRITVLAATLLADALLAAHAAAGRSDLRTHEEQDASLQTFIQGEAERFGRSATSHGLKARSLKGELHERHTHKKGDIKAHHKSRLRAMSLEAASAKLELNSRQAPVIYTPKIGVANVTEPTGVPPPPPTLNPWEDMQPMDTNIGENIVKSFEEPPTVTPMPAQSALDMAFGCPVLLSWPSNVEVQTPTPGTEVLTGGKWSAMGGDGGAAAEILTWSESCSLKEWKTTPTVTYAMPNGDHFGSSQMRTTILGTEFEIVDCALNLMYWIEEKVYHQSGKVDETACEKYNSCNGVVWLQYFIYDANGAIVGQTAYLNLFQDSYAITNTGGVEIATVTRADGWSPVDRSPANETRKWTIAYSSGAPGVWASAENRWPIAAMMTMLAMRDINRQPNGMVSPSKCAVWKSLVYIITVAVILIILIIGLMLFYRFCLTNLRHQIIRLEWKLCPKRMAKPTIYEGN